jgi:hypothetical protein
MELLVPQCTRACAFLLPSVWSGLWNDRLYEKRLVSVVLGNGLESVEPSPKLGQLRYPPLVRYHVIRLVQSKIFHS